MIRRTPKIILSIFCIICMLVTSAKADEVWLKDISLDQLQNLYTAINYEGLKGYLMYPDRKYPTIFLKNFPSDYKNLIDEQKRNALFIKILTPLILKLNQELENERIIIQNIADSFNQNNKLSSKEIQIIEQKSKKYDIFSRLKSTERYNYLITELLTRIDRIPPSIMITAAAMETNWGTSRIVNEGNSLYKMLVWHTDKGLKPKGETEDSNYRIKTYPDIYSSIQDFALKINSHKSFESLRNLRRERRKRTNNMSGLLLAPYVYGSSNLKNYAGIFEYTLAYYELLEIDKSTLDSNMVNKDLIKKYKKYVTKM